MGYSGWRVIREALTGNAGWEPVWRNPDPKPEYDIIIIGGGGHGLATAHYLAKEHGLTNVAGAGEGLSWRRQRGAQHDHRARQLFPARQFGVLLAFAQALGKGWSRT